MWEVGSGGGIDSKSEISGHLPDFYFILLYNHQLSFCCYSLVVIYGARRFHCATVLG